MNARSRPIITVGLMLVTAAALPCCSKTLEADACWSAGAKETVPSLLRQTTAPIVIKEIQSGRRSGQLSEQDRSRIENGIAIALDLYHVISTDQKTGTVHCGAQGKISLTGPTGHVESKPVGVEFDIYPGERSPVFRVEGKESVILTTALGTAFADDARRDAEIQANAPAKPPQSAVPAPADSGHRDVAELSEGQFNQAFRCPEDLPSEPEQKQAIADTLRWFGAHNKNLTVADFVRFRVALLTAHHCDETLRNMARNDEKARAPSLPQGTETPQAAPEASTRSR